MVGQILSPFFLKLSTGYVIIFFCMYVYYLCIYSSIFNFFATNVANFNKLLLIIIIINLSHKINLLSHTINLLSYTINLLPNTINLLSQAINLLSYKFIACYIPHN